MSVEVTIGLLVLFAVVFLLAKHVRKSKARAKEGVGAGVGRGGNPDRIDVDKV